MLAMRQNFAFRLRAATAVGLAATTVAAAAAPAASAADGWRELPPVEAPSGVANCLRDAGPGRVTLLGGFGARHADVDLLTIGDGGLAPAASTRFPALVLCPEVAGAAPRSGAAGVASAPLIAGVAAGARRERVWQLRRLLADAGGRPRTLGGGAFTDFGPTTVATSGSGAAIVAWSEQRAARIEPARGKDSRRAHREGAEPARPKSGAASRHEQPLRLLAQTRPRADAPFGRVQRLARGVEESVAGIDGAGRAHVAWAHDDRLHVASARPGRPFRETLRSLPLVGPGFRPSLVVAEDGRALVVAGHRSGAAVWELAPGARRWRRVRLPHVHGEQFAVALQPGGDAVVAGFEQSYDAEIDLIDTDGTVDGSGGVAISRRSGTGAFSAAQSLPDGGPRPGATGLLLFSGQSRPGEVSPPSEWREPELRAALSPTGELVVTWVLGGAQGQPPLAYAAHGTLAAGLGAPRRLGGACRAIADLTPVSLADGRLAVAWTDHGRDKLIAEESFEPGAGRLHVAVPDATVPPPPPAAVAPSVTVAATANILDPSADLPLTVRCDGGPCEVRVHATATSNASGRQQFGSKTVGSSVLVGTAAGETQAIELETVSGWSFVRPGRTGSVPLALTVCTPDGAAAATASASAELRTRPLPPMPRIVGATARLVGDRVVVRWRLTRPLSDDQQHVVGVQDRAGEDFASASPRSIRQRDGVYRTTIRLGSRDARSARSVVIQVLGRLVTFTAGKRVTIRGTAAPRRQAGGVRELPRPDGPPDRADPVPDAAATDRSAGGRSSPTR